jgi:hypothetical protein
MVNRCKELANEFDRELQNKGNCECCELYSGTVDDWKIEQWHVRSINKEGIYGTWAMGFFKYQYRLKGQIVLHFDCIFEMDYEIYVCDSKICDFAQDWKYSGVNFISLYYQGTFKSRQAPKEFLKARVQGSLITQTLKWLIKAFTFPH